MDTTIPQTATSPRSRGLLFGLAALQGCGYWALWALLHVAKAVPTSDNGFWTPKSAYAVRVGRVPIVALLSAKQHPYLAGLLFLGIVVLLCTCYGATILSLWRRPITLSTTTLLILTVVMALPLLVLPRILSSDVYAYGLYGRIAALYHANPFVTRPDQFPHDPLFPYIAWTTTDAPATDAAPCVGLCRAPGL